MLCAFIAIQVAATKLSADSAADFKQFNKTGADPERRSEYRDDL